MDYNGTMPSQTSTLSRAEKALIKRNVNRPALNNPYFQVINERINSNTDYRLFLRQELQYAEDSATLDSVKNKKAKSQPRGLINNYAT